MENMQSHVFNQDEPKPKRSTFLKVLCILSFCMCGFTFLSGLVGMYFSSPEVMQKNIEQVRVVNPEAADQMENQLIAMESNTYAKLSPYLGLMYTLLSFLGVLMMWHHNKNGLYIYSFSEILPYTGFIFMGKNSMSMMSTGMPGMESMMMVVVVLMVIIDVTFVVLYTKALNESLKNNYANQA